MALPVAPRRIAMISVHGCPMDQLGSREVGGMQVYVREAARALGRLGIDVDVFTRKTSPHLARVVSMDERARVIHLDAGPPRRTEKNHVVQYLPAFIENLDRFATREGTRYDIVHSHYWLSGWVGDRLADLWGVPHVTTFHTLGRIKNRANTADGHWSGALETDRRNEIERRVARRSRAIVVSTGHEREALTDFFGGRREAIHVIAPGADLSLFAPRPRDEARAEFGIAGEAIAFAGRIDPIKGIDLLLETLALLRARPSLRLYLAGGTPGSAMPDDADEAHLRDLARELRIDDRVVWLGAQTQDRLAALFSAADCVVVPSRHESFGLVALEAMACGAVVIASRVGGLPAIVRDGESGILVPWRTAEAFATHVSAVLDDPAYATALRRGAIAAAAGFSWDQTARGLCNLYNTLVGSAIACGGG
ncbi:MAG: glycosyltransferase family 1 protein [Chloroflexi bacterium]|nr:glycosyltransferase family 1 protein [Chloroflexota bacterium]